MELSERPWLRELKVTKTIRVSGVSWPRASCWAVDLERQMKGLPLLRVSLLI